MTAKDAYKIAIDVRAQNKDTRLDKYYEYVSRDILYIAKLGKLNLHLNYSDRVLTEEFVFKLQELLRGDGFNILIDEIPEKYREFTISWEQE